MVAEEAEQEVTSEEPGDGYQSAEQLGEELVTLSLLPESRWKSLLHLDEIKVRETLVEQEIVSEPVTAIVMFSPGGLTDSHPFSTEGVET